MKCKATLKLIRTWLRAPIMIEGKLVKRRKGVPQGSPLSPLLSNIMLHELDRHLEKRGLKYVRYADDFSIYCKKKSEARKMGNDVFLFLKNKLKLPINREPKRSELMSTYIKKNNLRIEERHTPTCELQATWLRICTHV